MFGSSSKRRRRRVPAAELKPMPEGSWLFRLYMAWMKRGANRL